MAPSKAQKLARAEYSNGIAEEIGELVKPQEETLARWPQLQRAIKVWSSGREFNLSDASDAMYEAGNHPGHIMMQLLVQRAGECAVYNMWAERGRVALDLNPYLAAELHRSSSDKMPGEVFDRLTHINPLITLPASWLIEHPDIEGEMSVRGFFVYGHAGRTLRYTNDPEREGLGVMFFLEQKFPDGEIGNHFLRMPLPTMETVFTLDSAVAYAQQRLDQVYLSVQNDVGKKIVPQLLRPTLSVLLYLCVDNRDIEEPPPPQGGRKARQKARRDPFYVRVGWHMGPALHEAQQRRKQGRVKDSPNTPSGVEYGPQHRAGHFKHTRYGPGRTKRYFHWVNPYWTKLDQLQPGEQPATTVIPVNPQRHDPLRRRMPK